MGIKLDGITKKHLINAKILLSDRSLNIHNGIVRVYRIEKDGEEQKRYILTMTYTTPFKIRREKVLVKSDNLDKMKRMAQNFLGKTIFLQDPYMTAEEMSSKDQEPETSTENKFIEL